MVSKEFSDMPFLHFPETFKHVKYENFSLEFQQVFIN